MTSTPAQTPARLPGPSTRVSVIVLVLGLLVGAFGLYAAVAPLFRVLAFSSSFPIPGDAHMHLSHGKYLVYQQNGPARTLTQADVTVTSDSDEQASVDRYFGSDETVTRNGVKYTSVLEIDVPAAGEYTVHFRPTAPFGRAIVARSLEDTVRDSLKWWGLVALAGLTAIAGTVMWIVGASRRRRQRMAYAYYGGTPAGWYPDPQQPGRLRYWDGTIWTEHVN